MKLSRMCFPDCDLSVSMRSCSVGPYHCWSSWTWKLAWIWCWWTMHCTNLLTGMTAAEDDGDLSWLLKMIARHDAK